MGTLTARNYRAGILLVPALIRIEDRLDQHVLPPYRASSRCGRVRRSGIVKWGPRMATFLLVQPAWLGGWCWDKVAMRLRAHGHDVYAPTLTGLGERAHLATPDVGLTTHIDDIVSVAEFDDLDDVILVGTSSGGTVITGVANRIPARIASLVYLDAFVPSDGQCTFDLLPPERRSVLEGLIETEGAGWLLPRLTPAPWPVILRDIWRVTDPADTGWMLPRLRPTPARHFTEPIPPPGTDADGIDRIYIRCLQCTPAPQFDAAAETARSDPAWRSVAIDTPHLPYVTHPDTVVTALTDVISH